MSTKRKDPIIRYSGRNRCWSEDDLDTLKTLTIEGVSWSDIAAVLGRTKQAVETRAGHLGLLRGQAAAWSVGEARTLEDMCTRGASWREISKACGRTVKACQQRWGFSTTYGASRDTEQAVISDDANKRYLFACMHELGATTPREFIRAYRSKHELNVPPEPAYKPTIPSATDFRSCVGSQAAMCEAF